MLHVVCVVNEHKNNEQTARTSSSIIIYICTGVDHDHMMAHLRLCLDLPLVRALTSTEMS